MASPSKKQPEAVADKVLKRAEVGKVRDIIIYLPAISTPLLLFTSSLIPFPIPSING